MRTRDDYYRPDGRHERNLDSLEWAMRSDEAWTQEEDDILAAEWALIKHTLDDPEDTLRDISQLLERTIEACRERWQHIKPDGWQPSARRSGTITTTRTTTTVITRTHVWADADEWPWCK